MFNRTNGSKVSVQSSNLAAEVHFQLMDVSFSSFEGSVSMCFRGGGLTIVKSSLFNCFLCACVSVVLRQKYGDPTVKKAKKYFES